MGDGGPTEQDNAENVDWELGASEMSLVDMADRTASWRATRALLLPGLAAMLEPSSGLPPDPAAVICLRSDRNVQLLPPPPQGMPADFDVATWLKVFSSVH